MEEYVSNLGIGKIVTKNEYCSHYIDDFKLVNNKIYIRTHASDSTKPHSLLTVSLTDEYFYHKGRTFFTEDGAKKYFTLAIGEEWAGGGVFDDFC